MKPKRAPKQANDERVSLAPLDPETALRALLAVKPDADEQDDQDDDATAERPTK